MSYLLQIDIFLTLSSLVLVDFNPDRLWYGNGEFPSVNDAKYESVSRWLKDGATVEAPIAHFQGGKFRWYDGRHRFAVLHNLGIDPIKIAVPPIDAERMERDYGVNSPLPKHWEEELGEEDLQ